MYDGARPLCESAYLCIRGCACALCVLACAHVHFGDAYACLGKASKRAVVVAVLSYGGQWARYAPGSEGCINVGPFWAIAICLYMSVYCACPTAPMVAEQCPAHTYAMLVYRFVNSPIVIDPPPNAAPVRFYAGSPLIASDGQRLGSL